jgi:hypothetical protein
MNFPLEVDICERHCSICEGQDHHWMEDFDEESGDPVWICKHCERTKPYDDDDALATDLAGEP